MDPIKIPTKWIPSEFRLDGQPVPILVKRLTHGQAKELRGDFRAKTEGKEGEPLNDAMTEIAIAWVPQYVRVAEGALIDPDNDNRPIVSGQELADALSARQDVMMALATLIVMESRLGSAGKNALRSAVGFLTGSQTPSPAASGDAPAQIAEPADAPGSIASAGATGAMDPASSGGLDPSSSDTAPSGI